jgi:transposase
MPPEPILAENASLKGRVVELETDLKLAELKIRDLERRLYGKKSERRAAEACGDQTELGIEVPEAVTIQAPEEVPTKAVCRPRVPRHPLPENLERLETRLDPGEKTCPECGKERRVIGEEVTEELDLIPARFVVRRIVRPKMACACGCSGVVIAPLPARPIEKGNAGPGLLSQIVLSKYVDHCPLARQSEIFRTRHGVVLPRQRLCDWVEAVATWLKPVYRQMMKDLMAGDFLQADETPVKILDPDHASNIRQGYLWTYSRPAEDVLFVCHPGRGHEHPEKDLSDFTGWLQCDAYQVYPLLARERPADRPLRLLGCWAHVRRKVIEAETDRPRAVEPALRLIRGLYKIEADAGERAPKISAQELAALRQTHAPPILDSLKAIFEDWQQTELPQGPLGAAARYALNQWEGLQHYLKDGRLSIDNNAVESAIRKPAMGRRNWLFLGHPDAAWRSAVIYSVVGSCRRRGIEPGAYLADLLRRLPSMNSTEVVDLVPARWKPASG